MIDKALLVDQVMSEFGLEGEKIAANLHRILAEDAVAREMWALFNPNDPPVVTEADIDIAAEIAVEDEDAEDRREADREAAECCGGRNPWCLHWTGGNLYA